MATSHHRRLPFRPNTCRGQAAEVPTVAINSLLVTNDKGLRGGRLPDDQGHLRQPRAAGQFALRRSPDQKLEKAVDGLAGPAHPGAEKFYREGPTSKPSLPPPGCASPRPGGLCPLPLSGTAMGSLRRFACRRRRQGHAARRLLQRDPFSVFQLVTSAFSPLSSTVVRALHVGFLLLLTFLLHPWRGGRGAPAWRPRRSASAHCCCRATHWIL